MARLACLAAGLIFWSTAGSAEPLVIAHRGASGYLPEHSLAGKALAHAMGADFLEQDVQLTRDGVPVVLHDRSLDAVTDVAARFPGRARADGRHHVVDFTLAEVRTLRIGPRIRPDDGTRVFPGRHDGTGDFRIPTLAEEIRFIQELNRTSGREAGLYVEVKDPAYYRAEGHDIARAVVDVLSAAGINDPAAPVYVQCFDFAETRRIRLELGWKGNLVQLIGENRWKLAPGTDFDHLRTGAGLKEIVAVADGIGPWMGQLVTAGDGTVRSTGLAEAARALGLKVHAYTFRADRLPKWAASFGEVVEVFTARIPVDGFFSDHPDQVRRFLDRDG